MTYIAHTASSLSCYLIIQRREIKEMEMVVTYHQNLSARVSEKRSNVFQRSYSSHEDKVPIIRNEEKVPVIRQLICYDEYDIQNTELVPLRKCLIENSIVQPISAAGLFRKIDLWRFGNLVLGDIGHPVLRQFCDLATVNLMRGVNISELIQLDNLLWSPKYKGIVLDVSSLSNDSDTKACPYYAARKVFKECLEISTGLKEEEVTLPEAVDHLLMCLDDAREVDKRLITNHSATRFPGERMQRDSRLNQIFRQDLPHHILNVTGDKLALLKKAHATDVFEDLARVFPIELLMRSGLHPFIDSWARQGQRMRGVKDGKSPIVLQGFPNGELEGSIAHEVEMINAALAQNSNAYAEMGKILMGIHRNPFEHLYQPLYEKLWGTSFMFVMLSS